jgi:hypothetical protein
MFASARERRLWFWAFAVLIAIYSTLGLAGTLVEYLGTSGLLDAVFFYTFLVLVACLFGVAVVRRPGQREVWVGIGVLAVYTMTLLRMGLVERSHLFEYSLLAVLIYQALLERRRNDRPVPAPAVVTIVATVALGWLDEGIQSLLRNRVYDIVDVGFNALAATMAVVASAALAWARRSAGDRLVKWTSSASGD